MVVRARRAALPSGLWLVHRGLRYGPKLTCVVAFAMSAFKVKRTPSRSKFEGDPGPKIPASNARSAIEGWGRAQNRPLDHAQEWSQPDASISVAHTTQTLSRRQIGLMSGPRQHADCVAHPNRSAAKGRSVRDTHRRLKLNDFYRAGL